jgi:hypothetical protein
VNLLGLNAIRLFVTCFGLVMLGRITVEINHAPILRFDDFHQSFHNNLESNQRCALTVTNWTASDTRLGHAVHLLFRFTQIDGTRVAYCALARAVVNGHRANAITYWRCQKSIVVTCPAPQLREHNLD